MNYIAVGELGMRIDSLRRSFLLFLLSAVLAAPSMVTAVQAAEVSVFAAASLKNALDDVAKAYEAKTGDKVVTSYAASSALAKQIESGAPTDIFFSADLDWMDYLQQKNLIDAASRRTLLGNTLVVVAPKDSTVSLPIEKNFPLLQALGADGKLAMASVDSVPAIRQSWIDLPGSMGRCRAPSGASRKRACRTSICGPGRSATWYRLCDRRQG